MARKNPLSDLLGKLKWGKHEAVLEIVHRGAPSDTKKIRLSEVEHVGKKFFVLTSGTKIPLHRIKKVFDAETGETFWNQG